MITGFVQARPDRGHPASEHTEVRILYDDHALYVGVELRDREPDKLVIPSLEQDFETGNSDIFGISLDTFLDRRNAFMLLVNPKGAEVFSPVALVRGRLMNGTRSSSKRSAGSMPPR